MSEPTIDEMMAWLDGLRPARIREVTAIRAILEQHRDGRASLYDVRSSELAAVRAFMERVHKRADDLLAKDKSQELYSEHFMQAFLDELKAMEKETE